MSLTPILERPLGSSTQRIYRFPNTYGASVVRGPYTYGGPSGLYELAVVKFHGEGETDYHLNYDTPVTDDVLGHLTEQEVEQTLSRIAALTRDGGAA